MNRCDPSTATDKTGLSSVTVTFANFSYSPACMKVSPGTQVTFSGSFVPHPLMPGVDCQADASGDSPVSSTASGTSAQFRFDDPGSYGYFCANHCGTFDMEGAVYVVP